MKLSKSQEKQIKRKQKPVTRLQPKKDANEISIEIAMNIIADKLMRVLWENVSCLGDEFSLDQKYQVFMNSVTKFACVAVANHAHAANQPMEAISRKLTTIITENIRTFAIQQQGMQQ